MLQIISVAVYGMSFMCLSSKNCMLGLNEWVHKDILSHVGVNIEALKTLK